MESQSSAPIAGLLPSEIRALRAFAACVGIPFRTATTHMGSRYGVLEIGVAAGQAAGQVLWTLTREGRQLRVVDEASFEVIRGTELWQVLDAVRRRLSVKPPQARTLNSVGGSP